VSVDLGYEIPRRTCRNEKQTMNDALSNVLNLAANMPTNDGAIQTRHSKRARGDLQNNASMRNPCNWMNLRPSFSIVKTVA